MVLQAFVAQVQCQVVGIVIIRDEQVGAVYDSVSSDQSESTGLGFVVVFGSILSLSLRKNRC